MAFLALLQSGLQAAGWHPAAVVVRKAPHRLPAHLVALLFSVNCVTAFGLAALPSARCAGFRLGEQFLNLRRAKAVTYFQIWMSHSLNSQAAHSSAGE